MTNQTQNAVSTPAIKKFEVGKTYVVEADEFCDSQRRTITIVKRTKCYAYFILDNREVEDDIFKRKINSVDNCSYEWLAYSDELEFNAKDVEVSDSNEVTESVEKAETAKFEVGKTYAAKKSVLFDSQINMTVINRTNCYVTFQFDEDEEDIRRCKIVDDAGVEKICLHESNAIDGDYEFSANDVADETATDEIKDTDEVTENEETAEVNDDDSKLAELFEDREVKRRAALHSSFYSEESKAARDANKAVEEFIGKVAKDLRAIAPEGLSVVDSWDSSDLDAPKFVVIELATDKRTCYGKIAQVKAALTVTKTDTPEKKVEKLFDAYEAQNSVAHISENGYIAAVNFQPHNDIRWHCKIRRYQNLDEAIDAVRYVLNNDTCKVTRSGGVDVEYGKRNEHTREYFARTLYGVEYFKEAYFDELVDQYAVTVDAFNFAVEYEIEEAEIAAAESRAIARILANDNLAARYEKAKSQVKCERYENGYCGWYFKGKHSDDWEHDETKAAACLTRYGLSRFEFSVLSEDETAVINSNGYDESAFDLLPAVDELNDCRSDIEKEFDEFAAEDTDRDARFNHGERHAANLEKQLRELDPTVEVTYDIDEDDKDVFYLRFGKYVYRTPFATLDAVEDTFRLWSEDDQVNGEFDKAVAKSISNGGATLKINGEEITFEGGQVTEVASLRYEAYFTIRNGRRNFYYRGNRVSKKDFFEHIATQDKALAQRDQIAQFVGKFGGSEILPGLNPQGNFVAQIHPTLANGRQDNYFAAFDTKPEAHAFISEFKTLASDLKFLASIKRDSFFGEVVYRHGLKGQEFFATDEPESDTAFDEMNEIGNDIVDTTEILEDKIANGAPADEVNQIAEYIVERNRDYVEACKIACGAEPNKADIDLDANKVIARATNIRFADEPEITDETDEDMHNTTEKIEVAIGADAMPAMIDLFEPNKITLNTPAQILKLIEDAAGNSFSFDYESYFINTDDDARHKFITRHFVSECKNYSFIEIFTDDGKLDCVEFLKHFLAGYKEVKFYLAAPAQDNVDKIIAEMNKRGCWVEYPEEEGDTNEKARLC